MIDTRWWCGNCLIVGQRAQVVLYGDRQVVRIPSSRSYCNLSSEFASTRTHTYRQLEVALAHPGRVVIPGSAQPSHISSRDEGSHRIALTDRQALRTDNQRSLIEVGAIHAILDEVVMLHQRRKADPTRRTSNDDQIINPIGRQDHRLCHCTACSRLKDRHRLFGCTRRPCLLTGGQAEGSTRLLTHTILPIRTGILIESDDAPVVVGCRAHLHHQLITELAWPTERGGTGGKGTTPSAWRCTDRTKEIFPTLPSGTKRRTDQRPGLRCPVDGNFAREQGGQRNEQTDDHGCRREETEDQQIGVVDPLILPRCLALYDMLVDQE